MYCHTPISEESCPRTNAINSVQLPFIMAVVELASRGREELVLSGGTRAKSAYTCHTLVALAIGHASHVLPPGPKNPPPWAPSCAVVSDE